MLTVREVAESLAVSATCVYQLISARKLPCHRIGVGRGAIRVSEADLAGFLECCRQGASFDPIVQMKCPPSRPKLKNLWLK